MLAEVDVPEERQNDRVDLFRSLFRRHVTNARNCAPKATKFSIYCAGEKAVEEITGGTGLIDRRRPALEVIRGVVDDRSKGRGYHHR